MSTAVMKICKSVAVEKRSFIALLTNYLLVSKCAFTRV